MRTGLKIRWATASAAALLLGQWLAMSPASAFEGNVDLNIVTPSPITVYPSSVLVVDGYAYVSDGSNGSPSYVSVVRVSDGTVTGWLPAGSNSAGIATAYGKVFVVAPYGQNVTVIDSSSRTVTATISNPGSTPPGGTAFANPIGVEVGTVNGHQYLFIASIYAGLTVVNAQTNQVVSTVPVPGENWGLAVSGNYAYVPDRYGATVTVIDITKAVNDWAHAVVSTIPLPASARPVSGLVAGGYVYMTDWHNGSVHLINISKAVTDPLNAYESTLVVGSQTFGGTVYGGNVYVPNGGNNTITVIDSATRTVTDTLTDSSLQGPGQGLSVDAGVLYVPSGGNHRLVGIRVGPASSSSSADGSQTREVVTLSSSASGAICTGGDPSGYSGTWIYLPSADQCTQSGPTAKADARLLGWATSASFPVARAQEQVDKGWGAIDEVINDTRMIFIPAGMAAFVTGSNNLFPIWSA